jgi:hypothetical protein
MMHSSNAASHEWSLEQLTNIAPGLPLRIQPASRDLVNCLQRYGFPNPSPTTSRVMKTHTGKAFLDLNIQCRHTLLLVSALSDPAPTHPHFPHSLFAIIVLTWTLQVHTPSVKPLRLANTPSLLMRPLKRRADITVLVDRHPSKAGVQTCGCSGSQYLLITASLIALIHDTLVTTRSCGLAD